MRQHSHLALYRCHVIKISPQTPGNKAYCPLPHVSAEDMMVSDLIYHDCVIKSPRTPKGLGQKTFQVGKHVEMQ